MKANCLLSFSLFLLALFTLLTVEANKIRPRRQSKQTWENKAKSSQLQPSVESQFYNGSDGTFRDFLISMFSEEDESGGGNISDEMKHQIGTSVRMTYEEMETEKAVIEEHILKQSNSKQPSKPQFQLQCNKAFIEYTVFTLIYTKQLPQEAVFSSWNRLPTLTEKISSLNQTLINYNLNPLPSCGLKNLDLNFSPQQFALFKLTQPTTTTNKENNEAGILDNVKLKFNFCMQNFFPLKCRTIVRTC